MRSFTFLAGSVMLAVLSAGGSSSAGAGLRTFTFRYDFVLGTSLDLKVITPSPARAAQADSAILKEIDREAKVLSAYDSSSEFSRWLRTKGLSVPVSPDLFQVLDLFDKWRDRTDGALDASAEVVTRVWKQAAAENRLPTQVELDAAIWTVKQRHWTLDNSARSATHLDNAPLALNSFAKSYIAGHAAQAAMATPQVSGVVVNIGGDLVVRGTLTEPVEIADPFSDAENGNPIASLMVHDRAVATSGNYRRGVEIDGNRYSHIVDPRTAKPAGDIVSSTVIAANAADAGALATAFSVLSPERSAQVAATMPGVDYLLVKKNGERIASAGWLAMAIARPHANVAPMAAGANGQWDPSMELTVSLELASADSFRARRPYLAVWIEDQDKFPVRTIALWVQKSRYIPELKDWYKDERLRSVAENSDIMRSVSSATRSPGRYTLKWDGKDNANRPVKAGRYTVLIEATREHGTYQLIRQDVDFNGAAKQFPLKGGSEIASADLDYRKAAH